MFTALALNLALTPNLNHLTAVRTADFDYTLPDDLIAQHPVAQRDASRLLVLNRKDGSITHTQFPNFLNYLRPGDVLVFNDSKVFNARLRGLNRKTGGEFELLLLTQNQINDWWVMLRPGKRARVGTEIIFKTPQGKLAHVTAAVLDKNDEGHRRLKFSGTSDILRELDTIGEVPLPPYIHRAPGEISAEDARRYQTVFAKHTGSVAAPTAGLHFTENIINEIRSKGVITCHVTLHVGLGTFAPVKVEQLEHHTMHAERYVVPAEATDEINRAKREGRRVIAVGTTSVRVLESAKHNGKIIPSSDETDIFIYPPFHFQIVDALLTNFHLPRSTLLMLVSAFAAPDEIRGRELIFKAYEEAVREHYRFFSYGDAMLIL